MNECKPLFGGTPACTVDTPEDLQRYQRWRAYDEPVRMTTLQALVTRRGWTNPWNPDSAKGRLAGAYTRSLQSST